jgi:hypothetical protein
MNIERKRLALASIHAVMAATLVACSDANGHDASTIATADDVANATMSDAERLRWHPKTTASTSASTPAPAAALTVAAAPAPAPTPGPAAPPTPATPSPLPSAVGLTACMPSGKGTDYQVGPNSGQLANLSDVPWESLKAGDTVRIFYRSAPYAGKFLIAAQGTTDAPVRICGVKGANGERPIITGANAVTRTALVKYYGNDTYASDFHQGRSVIVIKPLAGPTTQDWTAYPTNIQIDGLVVRSAHPNYNFTDASGAAKTYIAFGACIWVDRGQNITIADNEITDGSQGIFSKSTADGDFAVTKNLRIAGNTFTNNGIVGDDHMHSSYTQSHGVVYEFNHYGALRSGALGNSIKDRSVGTVVRYNRIEDGAHAIDLVEAEDFPYAIAQAAYRSTFVYGNQIIKNGATGSTIHYGGDHYYSKPGASWGEPIFRKGTLYFYNNTVRLTGKGSAVMFQISTTEERAEIWNNIFVYDAAIPYASLRSTSDVGAPWTAGGILNFGRNWINSRWADSDPHHTVPGQILGTSNFITGTTPPVDVNTLAPLAGSAVIDQAQALLAGASQHPVAYQLSSGYVGVVRTVSGSAADLGAIER